MKQILFIILVISLLFTACSNSEHNNVIETPKLKTLLSLILPIQ